MTAIYFVALLLQAGTTAVLHGSCPAEGKTMLTGDAKEDDAARNRAIKPVKAYEEWTGVVIEVTPQVPLPGYGQSDHVAMLHALQTVMRGHLRILAIGSLTYDNEHEVNADKRHPNCSNPKRISLWGAASRVGVLRVPEGDDVRS